MNKHRLIISLLLFPAFSVACNTAAPPQPVGETTSSRTQTMATPRPIPTPNEPAIQAAQNVEIEKLDGKTFKLADFRGKVLVLDFWATWCVTCVKQMPQLADLSKRYRDKGLTVVGLTFDEKTDQSKVTEFLKKTGADYTIGYDSRWLSSAFMKGTEDELGAPLPQLFVISREGRVVEHLIGENPERGIEYIERVVNEQLNGASK